MALLNKSISTGRLLLRPYRKGEGKLIEGILQRNLKRLKDAFPISIQLLLDGQNWEEYVEEKAKEWETGQSYYWGMWVRNPYEYIGNISIKHIQEGVPVAEVGYYLDEPYEGQGLMYEALEGAVAFAFQKLNIHQLILRIDTNNAASNRLAEKLGFTNERLIPNGFETLDGQKLDVNYHTLSLPNYLKR